MLIDLVGIENRPIYNNFTIKPCSWGARKFSGSEKVAVLPQTESEKSTAPIRDNLEREGSHDELVRRPDRLLRPFRTESAGFPWHGSISPAAR
jgi:hypothetical protein